MSQATSLAAGTVIVNPAIPTQFTTDTGVTFPSGNNLNILAQSTNTGITTNSASTVTVYSYTPANWIVDATANKGTHQTIATATASASAGDTIFIREGTYTIEKYL